MWLANRFDRRHRLVLAIVAVQVALLAGTAILQGARIAAGTHVRVAVQPVDPLDLARGAYVDLGYGFVDLPLPADADPGDDVLVVLERPERDSTTWRATGIVAGDASLDDGAADAWIRLGITPDGRLDTSPISTFYGSAAGSKRLEGRLVDGGVAVLSLDGEGHPTVVDVTGA